MIGAGEFAKAYRCEAAEVVTVGVAVASGVGGRRGRERRSAAMRYRLAYPWRWLCEHRTPIDTGSIGYRERRRLAKLRRRARDRDVAAWRNRWPRHEGDRIENRIEAEDESFQDFAPPWPPWWSTPEGRRAWLEHDRERKRVRRSARRALLAEIRADRETPAETLARVMKSAPPAEVTDDDVAKAGAAFERMATFYRRIHNDEPAPVREISPRGT